MRSPVVPLLLQMAPSARSRPLQLALTALGRALHALAIATIALAAVVAGPRSADAGEASAPPLTAIEYFHPLFDHYFVTASANEITALNSGQFSGWIPTGFSFPVLAPGDEQYGSVPVCRFYGGPVSERLSHFYSSSETECDEVLQRFQSWMLESRDVFRVYAADTSTGVCPSGTRPVRRLYNQREDANHRYTDDDAIASEMQLKRYVAEGFGLGSFPTAFCVPIPDAAIACSVAASDSRPAVGTTLTLTATCSGNPTNFQWIGCAGNGNTCTTTSTSTGARAYVLSASAGGLSSPPSVVSVVWQPLDPNANPNPNAVSCVIVATNTNPIINSDVTLTASCNDNPTRYSWNGCTTSTNTCTVRSALAGAMTYSMSAAHSSGPFSPATSIILNWIPLSAALACSVVTSNAQPPVNSSVTVSASCTGNPTSYTWSGCSSNGPNCTAASATAGSRVYSVVATNASASSPAASVVVNWQAAAASRPSCTLSASSTVPTINTSITLTASCSGAPTAFAWTGCASSTASCTTTSAAAGNRSYTVTASNAAGAGSPTTLTVDWKSGTAPPPPGPAQVSCTLASNNALPVVNSSVTLVASCTGSPSSYTWTSCPSTSTSCTTTSSTTGATTYSVVARNATSTSVAASTTVTWIAVPPAPAGMPTSATYTPKQNDPRGIDAGYATFRRAPNGHGIAFAGNSHDRKGNNSVWTFDPIGNAWTMRQPHRAWNDVPVAPAANGPPWEARGLSFLGNSDNGAALVVDNEYWHFRGEKGQNVVGNYRGILDTTTWQWTFIDDIGTDWPRTEIIGDDRLRDFLNSAYGYIPSLDMWYMFGGDVNGNPWDGLYRIERNPGRPRPYKATFFGSPLWGTQAFSGSERLRYISNQHFARGTKLYVYGGVHEARSGGLRTKSKTLWEIDIVAPSMRALSANALPDGQRVEGGGLLAYHDPVKDLVVATDGQKVNVYDFASSAWVYVPITNAADPDRLSPTSDGAGRAGFYSPALNEFVILGGHARVYTLKLNYGAAPPTSPPPPPAGVACTVAASNAAPTINTNVTLTATCTGSPTSYTWTNCTSTTANCTSTMPTVGVRTYSVTARNATSTSTPASVSVTWVAVPAPPPPPPPPSGTGTLKLASSTTPLAGPSSALGVSKHLNFARLGNRWYKMVGDHRRLSPGSPDHHSGRQEIISFNVPANDWRIDQPFYVPDPAQVQVALPDDAFTAVRNDEAWVFVSARAGTVVQVPGMAQQIGGMVMAWKPGRGWRSVVATPPEMTNNFAWRAIYDPVQDRFIIPADKNGLVWVIVGGDGVDRTQRTPTGVPYTFGNYRFHIAGMAVDWTKRTGYVYDHIRAELWAFDLDSLALRKIADIPELQGLVKVAITWHDDLRAVIIGGTMLHGYEVDTGKITTWQRPDGFVNGVGNYVPPSTMFFDPDTRDIVSIGSIDWDTSMDPGHYWRLKITR